MATSLFSRSDVEVGDDPADQAVDILARSLRAIVAGIPVPVRTVVALAARGGALVVAGVVAVAAVVVFVLVLGHYGEIISLYESLQSGLVGGIALTVGQLSLIPNLVVWAASWLLGPGFALGSGSLVSPLGTQVGLLPVAADSRCAAPGRARARLRGGGRSRGDRLRRGRSAEAEADLGRRRRPRL